MRTVHRPVPDGHDVSAAVRLLARALLGCVLLANAGFAQTRPSAYRAVLVAGEIDVPVFDRAVAVMAGRLMSMGNAAQDIARFSASPAEGVPAAALTNVLATIGAARPGPGQACFVFVTSHGQKGMGLFLRPREEFLTPVALDRALLTGCGDAPTVVIASGCYSGGFAGAPMTRRNRIVLTAARADRPSFGCGADDDFTVYDGCLLSAMRRATLWRDAWPLIRACVTTAERAEGYPPSGPRAWFGAAVKDLPVAGRW